MLAKVLGCIKIRVYPSRIAGSVVKEKPFKTCRRQGHLTPTVQSRSIYAVLEGNYETKLEKVGGQVVPKKMGTTILGR
jgi:hypothetical protein